MKLQGFWPCLLAALAAGAAPPTPSSPTASRAFRGALLDDAGQRSDLRLHLDPARLAEGQIDGNLEFERPLGGRGAVLGRIQDDLCVFQGTMDRGFDFSFRGRCSADLVEGTYVVSREGGVPRPGRFRAQAGEGKVQAPKAPESVAPPASPRPRPH